LKLLSTVILLAERQ